MTTETRPVLGLEVARSEWTPRRSVLVPDGRSPAGNTILRVGRETEPGGPWQQTEHVVLTPEETAQLVALLTEADA